MTKLACIVPTCNAEIVLARLLDSLDQQTCSVDIFVVDSSSSDSTIAVAHGRSCSHKIIARADFNHGGTRQMMINEIYEYDIFIFLTQDAYLEGASSIEYLVSPFADERVGAVCGRQLPHFDASLLAQHARFFNYPASSRTVSLSDAPKYGMKTPFISNSFAAYRGSALREVGGFPRHVILAEDMYVAARMLLGGWKVVYEGRACCRHSHNYSLVEEFRRYFDIGVFHSRERWIRDEFGSAGGEGVRYVVSELQFLGWRRMHLWPSSLLRNILKLFAYKLAQYEAWIPVGLKRQLSMHKHYWEGTYSKCRVK